MTRASDLTRTARIISRIVTAVLSGYQHLPLQERERALQDVTDYTLAQIANMPLFMKRPYQALLLFFDFACLIRYARTFLGLSPEKQRDYVGFWLSEGVGPLQDFLKPIVSFSLLRYFDDHRVLGALEKSSV